MKELIEIEGIEYLVEFDFQPFEPMVMYYKDGTGHPGTDASIDHIYEAINQETGEDELDQFDLDEVESLLWRAMENRDQKY